MYTHCMVTKEGFDFEFLAKSQNENVLKANSSFDYGEHWGVDSSLCPELINSYSATPENSKVVLIPKTSVLYTYFKDSKIPGECYVSI